VIRICFSAGVLQNQAQLDQRISELLSDNQSRLNVTCTCESLGGQLSELIHLAHEKAGQSAAVLIDKYDKPILDNTTNSTVALEMREGLKNMSLVLKGSSEHLKFSFLTGCPSSAKSVCSRGSITSRTSRLMPSLARCAATPIPMWTSVFAQDLPGLGNDEIRRSYHGYNWLASRNIVGFEVETLVPSLG